MGEMLVHVAAITVSLALLAAVAEHLWRPGVLPDALRAHRAIPALLVRPVAAGIVFGEAWLGAATVAAALAGDAAVLRLAGAGCTALFTVYLLYGWLVRRIRPGTPCGCSAASTPMSGWVLVRSGGLAGMGAVAAAGAEYAGSLTGMRLVVTVLAGATFAVLLRELPIALFDPAARPAGVSQTA